MPSLSSVRLTARADCPTSRIISAFSDAEYLMPRPPHPRSRFFRADGFRASVQRRPPSVRWPRGAGPLPRPRLLRGPYRRRAASSRPQGSLSTSGNTDSGRSLHDGTARRCSPRRAGLPAQCGSSLLPRIAGVSPAGCLSRPFPPVPSPARSSVSSSLLKGYDEPEILPSSTRPICLIGADAGQAYLFVAGQRIIEEFEKIVVQRHAFLHEFAIPHQPRQIVGEQLHGGHGADAARIEGEHDVAK